jgi:hypothetical protein
MQATSHCDDCLVTALLHPPGEAVVIDEDLSPSIAALTGMGLVPVLRFKPRAGRPAAPPGDGGALAG